MTDKTCFVIQPFCEIYENLFDIFYKPAIERAGLTVLRADGPKMVEIPDYVRKCIRDAHICFIDITVNKPNIWYELGFADALNKPIVIVSNKDFCDEKKFPSDISGRFVIFYESKVGSNKPYRESVIEKIIEQIEDRVKTADSDSNISLVPAQQPQNSDNLTALEGEVLMKICSYCSRHNRAISREDIISNSFSENGDVPDAIGKIKLDEYIEEIAGFLCEDGQSRYCPTKKGERWYYDNKDNQSTHSTFMPSMV